MSSPSQHRLFFLLVVTMVWSAAIETEANGIASAEAEQLPAGCYFSGKPILDAELAQRSDCLVAVTTKGAAGNVAHNVKLFRLNTYMDFLFIVLYWKAFVLFARFEESPWTKWVIGFLSASALFDVSENLRILKALVGLESSQHIEGLLPRPFSQVKWALLAASLGIA